MFFDSATSIVHIHKFWFWYLIFIAHNNNSYIDNNKSIYIFCCDHVQFHAVFDFFVRVHLNIIHLLFFFVRVYLNTIYLLLWLRTHLKLWMISLYHMKHAIWKNVYRSTCGKETIEKNKRFADKKYVSTSAKVIGATLFRPVKSCCKTQWYLDIDVRK